MIRRKLGAPIRNNLGLLRRAALLLLVLPSACGETSVSTDTRTNWLTSCSEDDDCSAGLSCLCGVCTQACSSSSACRDLSSDAVCVAAPGCSEAGPVCAREDSFMDVTADASTSGLATTGAESSNTATSDSSTSSITSTTVTSEGSSTGVDTSTSGGDMDASQPEETTTDVTTSSGDQTDASICDNPEREYQSRNPMECESLPAPDCGIVAEGFGRVAFSDECGCGCEPFVPPERSDSLTAGYCNPNPSSGSFANFTVLAESVEGQSLCFDVPSALLRSADDVTEWTNASGCGDIAPLVADVNFAEQSVIVVGTPDRPQASVSYVTQTIDGAVHVGVDVEPYCGGARPPSGFVLVVANVTPGSALQVVTETCDEEQCPDAGLPVP